MTMAKTAQLNARLDQSLKEKGDAVLNRFGRTATDAIRSLWAYMAATQALPHFMLAEDAEESASSRMHELAESGVGMANALAAKGGLQAIPESMTYEELREAAFEEMLAEGRLDLA